VEDRFRVAKDGYVYALAKTSLGLELDHAMLESHRENRSLGNRQ
jgi:hypothetical protein